VSACPAASHLSCRRLLWLAQTQKQNRRQNKGVFAHKGTQISVVIKFLSILTKHTGTNCNQPVEPVKDWNSDSLTGQNLLVGYLCGVRGRLHSIEGLAQSNNHAKLNNSATHDQTLLEINAEVGRERSRE
jgi:hypothetical protein